MNNYYPFEYSYLWDNPPCLVIHLNSLNNLPKPSFFTDIQIDDQLPSYSIPHNGWASGNYHICGVLWSNATMLIIIRYRIPEIKPEPWSWCCPHTLRGCSNFKTDFKQDVDALHIHLWFWLITIVIVVYVKYFVNVGGWPPLLVLCKLSRFVLPFFDNEESKSNVQGWSWDKDGWLEKSGKFASDKAWTLELMWWLV